MTDQSGAATQTTQAIRSRHRSPNYPSIGLKAAVGKIETIYQAAALAPLMRITALKALGFEKLEGDGARMLSALRSFGLLEEVSGDRLKITQRGLDIVARPPSDPIRVTALRSAVNGPTIYRDLLTEFSAGIPSDAALKSELIAAKKFNPNAVDGFILDFKDSLEFAGISKNGLLDFTNEGKRESQQSRVQVGDYVQWEFNGTHQFSQPKLVRGLSDDGQWVFLKGSDTGVPIAELSVEEAQKEPLPTHAKTSTPPVSIESSSRRKNASETLSPSKVGMRSDVFSLSEGTVTIQWPESLSAESFEDLSDWLNILKRKIGRSVSSQ